MPIHVTEKFMFLEIDGSVVAAARFSQHAAADGHGAWIVSCRPACLFTRNQAITALTVVELLAGGYADDHPLVTSLREEIRHPACGPVSAQSHRRQQMLRCPHRTALNRLPLLHGRLCVVAVWQSM